MSREQPEIDDEVSCTGFTGVVMTVTSEQVVLAAAWYDGEQIADVDYVMWTMEKWHSRLALPEWSFKHKAG